MRKKYKLIGKKQNLFLGEDIEIGERILFDVRDGRILIDGPSYLIGNTKFHASGGTIRVGKNVTIGEYSFLNGAGGITIEDNVLCADKVNFVSSDHGYKNIEIPIRNQDSDNKPIVIREGSWIGINVSILGGAVVGKNSVVGANSVVKGEFPDYCVIAGCPARIVKRFNGEKWIKSSELRNIVGSVDD